ncbi:SWI/SNF-related matrix-associated actin-dependent regulator of chromatin subfamily A containing DEAD/H box 1-like isoform X3 [Halichondria panicea]|uniref:SWI/SNF-related matrix-associated actin-dependent regulator of chromatin subfamily A containing DEAD/H box 1-like isoform X3 n=1 Tax=Halichondria panicea TaxID=6063 RepID=UPI00312B9E25
MSKDPVPNKLEMLPQFNIFSNFAFKKRKRFSLDNDKENCEKKMEDSPPVEAPKEVIPETPSSLLPSLTVPAVEEQTSPRRFSALAKKPRKCARIVSSDEEEEGESSSEVNGLFKRRKLFTTSTQVKGVSVKDAIDVEDVMSDSDSSPDLIRNRKQVPRPKRSVYIQSDSDSDVPSSNDRPRAMELKESSEWLSSSRRKLQKFAFQKSKITNDSEEIKTHSEAARNCKKVKKRILIESSDSDDDRSSSRTVDKLSSMETKQSVQSCETTADVVELTDSYRDEYSGSESEEDGYSVKQKKSILKFMNDSSLDELCDIPRCSVTKAKLIDKHRPFETWKHLVEGLVAKKGLSEQLLEGCLTLLAERKVLVRLLAQCRTISTSIQDKFSHLQNSECVSTTGDDVVYSAQPAVMNPSVQLKEYQLLGLNWLVLLHSQDLNAILADEMGLGKTVEAISFLSHLYQLGSSGHFLVVVPSSTLDNWVREFEVWCPAMTVIAYWGSQQDRSQMRYEILSNHDNFDVILTTYNVCIGQAEDRKFFRKLSLDCLVLDEGHMLKNMNSLRYTHLMKIQRVDESSAYYQEQVRQAKQIMTPFTLRRLKSQVLSQLPAKVSSTEHCQLTETQWTLYRGVVERSLRVNQGRHGDELNKRMDVMVDLRKATNHPLLLRHHYTDHTLHCMVRAILKEPSHRDAAPNLVWEDMSVMSDFELHNLCTLYKSLSEYALPGSLVGMSGKCEFLSKKLSQLKKNGDRVLVFSQFTMMLDILEVFLQQQGHAHLRLDGQTPVTERQGLIDQFNEQESIFVFLLSTRAGGLGINLTSANVVIIHDIDFNPYNDKQAEDRCHRVGQTRDVTVLRLVGSGTVEEDILQCAQSKLRLEHDLTASTDHDDKLDVTGLLQKALARSQTMNLPT